MKKRKFGATNQAVAMVGQGTWQIEYGDQKATIRAMQKGLDLGMTHIDTAEMYGNGKSEALVGMAVKGRRDEVFLVSKVLPSNASSSGTIKACEESLKQLQTDRLDCYLLHWRGSYDLTETVEAFEKLKADGKILSWGVSNFDVDDLEEVIAAAGDNKVACNQVLYHLNERAIEHAVVPWCQKHNIAVVAYSPYGQANGFPKANSAAGKVLQKIATAHNATPRQVALAFLLRNEALFAIPKASSIEHLTENSGAAELRLSLAEIAEINAACPAGRPGRSLPMI
ncbi:MAG: aldo/keto reductase [Candidatus Obscuribacterales bacterium]|nr:aldo/keto reductase [Candidatus Obscuribacterales bacterium]